MPKLIDLTGKRYGRVVVLRRGGGNRWICLCDCGITAEITGPGLRGGLSKSCGCLRREVAGAKRLNHGKSNTRAQRIWSDMRRRCTNEKRPDFQHYGGRGITVCSEWNDLARFIADMGEPPDDMTLDRIDPEKEYGPGNCRWVSRADQQRNKRSTLWVEWRGERVSLAVVAAETGLPYESLRYHVNRGVGIADAVAHVMAHPYQSRGVKRRRGHHNDASVETSR